MDASNRLPPAAAGSSINPAAQGKRKEPARDRLEYEDFERWFAAHIPTHAEYQSYAYSLSVTIARNPADERYQKLFDSLFERKNELKVDTSKKRVRVSKSRMSKEETKALLATKINTIKSYLNNSNEEQKLKGIELFVELFDANQENNELKALYEEHFKDVKTVSQTTPVAITRTETVQKLIEQYDNLRKENYKKEQEALTKLNQLRVLFEQKEEPIKIAQVDEKYVVFTATIKQVLALSQKGELVEAAMALSIPTDSPQLEKAKEKIVEQLSITPQLSQNVIDLILTEFVYGFGEAPADATEQQLTEFIDHEKKRHAEFMSPIENDIAEMNIVFQKVRAKESDAGTLDALFMLSTSTGRTGL